MKCVWAIWLYLGLGIVAQAQNKTWQTVWKEAKLPKGWLYATTDYPRDIADVFGLGRDKLLGKIVFAKGRHWRVVYYAYYVHDATDAKKMMDQYMQHTANRACWKKNIPEGKGEWTVKAQGYTSYLQVDDVLYLLDDCRSTPCPYTAESQAFIRSLLEFMYRPEE